MLMFVMPLIYGRRLWGIALLIADGSWVLQDGAQAFAQGPCKNAQQPYETCVVRCDLIPRIGILFTRAPTHTVVVLLPPPRVAATGRVHSRTSARARARVHAPVPTFCPGDASF